MEDLTDKELLELAAKSAGVEWQSYDLQKGLCLSPVPKKMYITAYWNPLTDDGDAFRLAVKLKMNVSTWGLGASAYVVAENSDSVMEEEEPHYGDYPERATRRAIVRCAAEMQLNKGRVNNE